MPSKEEGCLSDTMQSLARGTITKDRLDLDHIGGKDIGSKRLHDAFRLACHCVQKSQLHLDCVDLTSSSRAE